MKKNKQKIIIVGKGSFGVLMTHFLRPYFSVQFIRRSDDDSLVARKLGGAYAILYSVPFSGLESSILQTKVHVTPDTIVIDVMSVKTKPLQLLRKHFKNHQVLGTHPIFGPQSVKQNGGDINGLPLVLCNQSCTPKTYKHIKSFCKNSLGCKIIEQTPEQHDHEMAHVQGLSHLIGRALKNMDIESYSTNTQSYQQLLELRDLLAGDSWDLFETIQNTNPQVKRVRNRFLKELRSIDIRL